ncbi:MAG: DUF6712 family protein [Algoriphagus aquaeductus]|uniref:DUF6712 family protein n=1 Tax=Algoriphagus aquaeductus TaxID=475299 RepID=UPI003919D546
MILFKSDKIKERISSTTTFDPQLHRAHLARAYRNHIRRYFPEEQLKALETELATPLPEGSSAEEVAARAKKEALYSLFYDALAPLGYYYTIPHLEVTVTASGIMSVKTADREKADARQIIRLEKSYAESGLESLDELIKYLIAESVLFSWFPDVMAASGHLKLILSDQALFQRYVDINGSALVYQQLRPVIHHIERLEVKPIIGADRYTAFQTALASNHADRELQETTYAYIACRAMAEGLRMKDVGMNEKGIYQIHIENRDYGKRPPASGAVLEKINRLNELAKQYRSEIEAIITPPAEGDTGILGHNSEDSGFFHTWG